MTATTINSPLDTGSGTPALSDNFVETRLVPVTGARTMTVAGVSVKTLILLAVVVAGGAWGWASDSFRTAGVIVTAPSVILSAPSLPLDFGRIERRR